MGQSSGVWRAQAQAAGEIGRAILVLAARDPLDGDLLLRFPVLRDNAEERGGGSARGLDAGSMGRADLHVALEGREGALIFHVLPTCVSANEALRRQPLEGESGWVAFTCCPIVRAEKGTPNRDAQGGKALLGSKTCRGSNGHRRGRLCKLVVQRGHARPAKAGLARWATDADPAPFCPRFRQGALGVHLVGRGDGVREEDAEGLGDGLIRCQAAQDGSVSGRCHSGLAVRSVPIHKGLEDCLIRGQLIAAPWGAIHLPTLPGARDLGLLLVGGSGASAALPGLGPALLRRRVEPDHGAGPAGAS
eukprot:1214159-Alexandrium_andersonii.AAC.2